VRRRIWMKKKWAKRMKTLKWVKMMTKKETPLPNPRIPASNTNRR
jgi:hypothetical protein